jgi:hypothetical protein
VMLRRIAIGAGVTRPERRPMAERDDPELLLESDTPLISGR